MFSLFSKKDYKHIVEYGQKIHEDLRLKKAVISFFKMNDEFFVVVRITGMFFLSNNFVFNLNDFIEPSKIEFDRVQLWIDKLRNEVKI